MIHLSACQPQADEFPALSGRHGQRRSYTTQWDTIISFVKFRAILTVHDIGMPREDRIKLEFKKTAQNVECYTSQRWHGLSVEFSRLKLPDEYAFRWNGDAHYLAFHDLVLSDGEMEVLGEKPIAGGDLRNRMTYIPKGQTISGWAKPANRMNAFTAVYFCPLAMEEELQVTFTPFDYQPNIYFQDHVLGATMRKLGDLLSDSDKSACKVYAETLGLTAALELFRIERGEPFKLHAPGQLSQQQSKLMRDYIEQNRNRCSTPTLPTVA